MTAGCVIAADMEAGTPVRRTAIEEGATSMASIDSRLARAAAMTPLLEDINIKAKPLSCHATYSIRLQTGSWAMIVTAAIEMKAKAEKCIVSLEIKERVDYQREKERR